MTLAARHNWHVATSAAALAIPAIADPLCADALTWEAIGTGGNCEAWSTESFDRAAAFWICDGGNGLGDASTTFWMIGLHPHGEWRDHWQGEAPTMAEALALVHQAHAARAFALGFNPNAPMTFAEFVASGREPESSEGFEPGRVYADHCHIAADGAAWSLTIGNMQHHSDTLAPLEHELYRWAAAEGYLTRPYAAQTPAKASEDAAVSGYRHEFPDFDPATMPAIPEGWEDISWHNDTCPSFKTPNSLHVFVDYADDDKRDLPGGERFSVNKIDADGVSIDFESVGFITNDWLVVLEIVAGYMPPAPQAPAPVMPVDELAAVKAALAAEYVKRIGYDPFADCPTISAADVVHTLLGHADENLAAAFDCMAENIAGVIATARRNATPAGSQS